MKKTNIIIIISICFMAASIFLMCLPYGVAMKFVNNPGPPMEYATFNYSYISGMPIGYGNWFPIITVIISFTVLLMLIVSASRNSKSVTGSKNATMICLSICVIATLLSWLLFSSVSVIGVIVCILHFATLTLQIISNKIKSEERNEKMLSLSM